MKKIISFLAFALLAICASAQESVYLQDCAVQVGAKAVIKVIVAHDTSKGCIGSMQFNYSFDDGIIVRDNGQDVVGVGATTVNDKTNFVLLGGMESTTAAAPEGACVCVFNIDIPANMTIGEHKMSISNVQAVYEDGITDFTLDYVESTMTVQKTAVIEEMPEGFGVEIIPFVAEDGDVTLEFNYKSEKDIKNLSFDVELPEGMYFIDDAEWDKSSVQASLSASCTGAPTLSYTLAAGDKPASAKISVAGAYTTKSKKYINASTSFASLANISACVLTEQDIDEFEWDGGIMTEGISTIKLSNIVLEDVNGNIYSGEYLASVIYGQPSAQETILYGHYTKDAVNAFNTAMKNIAVANITATTIDNGVGNFQDVITVDDSNNWVFYFRKSENYATTVMPYELKVFTAADFPELNLEEKEPYCQLFTVESMTAESIVIKELPEGETIPANTPCIFKGVLSFLKTEEPLNLGSIKEQILGGTTFKGTYEATSIDEGAGYYISSDGKFYSDGATVRPFRGYFDGTIAGVKSFSVKLDTANGLIDITDQFSAEDIYSLQGIKMNKTQKGVNIVNGKKVYVK